jgi:uncharacterized membrane protein YeaQ/YmgE (transglycosylase-associated protein family)
MRLLLRGPFQGPTLMPTIDAQQGLVLTDTAQHLVNDVLVWIGFGTVIGLLAKGIMPGRDPGGAIATVLMGIGGTVLGCGVVSYFNDGVRVVPVSPLGMLVGTGGTLLILFFYKLLGGYYFLEGEYVSRNHRQRLGYSARRRKTSAAVYED